MTVVVTFMSYEYRIDLRIASSKATSFASAPSIRKLGFQDLFFEWLDRNAALLISKS